MSCEQCFTGFSVNTVKQTADRQNNFVKEGKVWIQENKDFLLVLPVRPLWLSLSFLSFSSQKRPITTAQERAALFAPAFIRPNRH